MAQRVNTQFSACKGNMFFGNIRNNSQHFFCMISREGAKHAKIFSSCRSCRFRRFFYPADYSERMIIINKLNRKFDS